MYCLLCLNWDVMQIALMLVFLAWGKTDNHLLSPFNTAAITSKKWFDNFAISYREGGKAKVTRIVDEAQL